MPRKDQTGPQGWGPEEARADAAGDKASRIPPVGVAVAVTADKGKAGATAGQIERLCRQNVPA